MRKINVNEDPFGVLVVDKEKGMTSHDVVARVRRRFSIKKVGHAGTLDPNATGVLLLLLGKATRLSNTFLDQDKEYEATMKLGEKTDSGDCAGSVIRTREVRVSAPDVENAMERFVGEIEQVPPMFSAKKIKGKKLYEFARKGVEVEREPKKVIIKELKAERIDLPFVVLRVVCGKGTYIRQLADDIGDSLDCGAHLTELRRTRSGEFSLSQAVSLGSLLDMDRDAVAALAKKWVYRG